MIRASHAIALAVAIGFAVPAAAEVSSISESGSIDAAHPDCAWGGLSQANEEKRKETKIVLRFMLIRRAGKPGAGRR